MKIQEIIEAVQAKTAIKYYRICTAKDSIPDIFDSKLGGMPYWDIAKPYPVDSNNKKMSLLAQINLQRDGLLDKKGMLQFFIAQNDVYGADFDALDSQKDFRVVYHTKINYQTALDDIKKLGIPEHAEEYMSPIEKETKLEFIEGTDFMGTEHYMFDTAVQEVMKEQFGIDMEDKSVYNYFSEEEYNEIASQLTGNGHKLLGYPAFTQGDPREYMNKEQAQYYDTLLLQIDSDFSQDNTCVMWGDCGVGNFFINHEALEKKDFSKVLYTWDCC